jgi:hypothetical protein
MEFHKNLLSKEWKLNFDFKKYCSVDRGARVA